MTPAPRITEIPLPGVDVPVELEPLTRAAVDAQRLADEARAASQRLDDAVWAAHEAGWAWAVIGAAIGGSEAWARLRGDRARPDGSRWKPSPRKRPTVEKRPAPGLTITETARRLGVTRQTVYNRLERGELSSVTDEGGRVYVTLEDQ